jgi:hypothetical protein
MDNASSDPTVVNCTFGGTLDPYGVPGPGMHNSDSSPTISNSIFWSDTTVGGIDDYGSSSPVVTHSCVKGGYPGAGNIDTDPRFVRAPNAGPDGQWNTDDDDYGDLHLLPDSPCIDAGTNAAVPPDSADLDADGNTTEPVPLDADGLARFVDHSATPDCQWAPGTCGTPPIVDMGATEYQSLCLCGDIDGSGGLVTLSDFATFALCFGLPAPNPPDCDQAAFECSDLDGNAVVELGDFATFALWFGLQSSQHPPDCEQ